MDQVSARRFGQWLHRRRKAAGLGTTELAKRTGITDGTITRLEQGYIARPDPNKLSRIAEVLDIPLADIYAMAGYDAPEELPTFRPYLRSKYRDLPVEAVQDLDEAFVRIIRKHGYDAEGPEPGEDEQPDPEEIESLSN
ncbi:MAG TPA: helix-turn-helix transcriptional regulator [Gaiellaceae bacterium]|nr:helix-turn-helix transcriptional regulator [Gaiellaceae bacterium]